MNPIVTRSSLQRTAPAAVVVAVLLAASGVSRPVGASSHHDPFVDGGRSRGIRAVIITRRKRVPTRQLQGQQATVMPGSNVPKPRLAPPPTTIAGPAGRTDNAATASAAPARHQARTASAQKKKAPKLVASKSPPRAKTPQATTTRAGSKTSPPRIAAASSRRPPPLRIKPTRPVLGDGSIAGELLAAAKRLLGKRFGPGEMLAHLLTVAAVDLSAEASAGAYQDTVWLELEARGQTFLPGERKPRPGDLVFFRDPPMVDGDPAFVAAGVVERTDGGTVEVIGEVHGRMERIVMTPDRPFARRDESTGRMVNTPIRPRSLDQGPDLPVHAGALVAGFARP